jgi:hypothetical protein
MLWPRRVWWVAGELPVSAAPTRCAGCSAELAAETASPEPASADAPPETAADALGTSAPALPQCSTCRRGHERQRDAIRLAMALAALSGAACALVLPLLRPEMGLAGHLLATLLASGVPLSGLSIPIARAGGAGCPARLWPLGPLGHVVEGAELAAELRSNGGRCRALWLPPFVYRPGVALLAALSLTAAAVGHAWHHPRVSVLVLGSAPLTLSVDGAVLARLEPLQAGADEALQLRLPSGARHLIARDDDGRIVTETTAMLSPGRDHLFAPGGSDECFWLERTGYGRDRTQERVPLRSASRFFTLDQSLDGWLSGSPPPPASDRRSTGGTLELLRHSACPHAPELIRAASAARP